MPVLKALNHLLSEKYHWICVAGQLLVDIFIADLAEATDMGVAGIVDKDRDVYITEVL